jgi:hypothetical protein
MLEMLSGSDEDDDEEEEEDPDVEDAEGGANELATLLLALRW